MAYHRFTDQTDGEEYGSFEVFWSDELHADGGLANLDETRPAGWFWWACFPGCLPDGDAFGPFATEQEAIRNANEGA